jgi:uncharacterized protein (DUF1778 family)
MGTPATRAKNKYQAKKYDRHSLLIPKGRKEIYQAAADASGQSLTAYIIEAIEQRMEREGRA